jgi:hypothetical protein
MCGGDLNLGDIITHGTTAQLQKQSRKVHQSLGRPNGGRDCVGYRVFNAFFLSLFN